MRIDQALEEMELDYRAANNSEATLKAYNSMVGAFGRFCGKHLHQITRKDVRDYMLSLQGRNAYEDAPQKPEQNRGLSPYTIASHDRHLRGFFNWAVDVGHLEESPMKRLKRPRVPRRKPKAVSARQFVALLEAAQDYHDPIQGFRNVALLAVLADTGARISEVVSLSSETLDLNARRAWVESKGYEREVFFSEFTRKLMRRWLDYRESVSKYLFTSMTTGEPLTVSGADQILKRLKKQAGVKGRISAHRFRNAFAVEFVKAGGDISTLAALLGLGSINITAAYYAVFSHDELAKMQQQYNPLRELLKG